MQKISACLSLVAVLAGCVAPAPTTPLPSEGPNWDDRFLDRVSNGRFAYATVDLESGALGALLLPGNFSSIRVLDPGTVAVGGLGADIVVQTVANETLARLRGRLFAASETHVYVEDHNLTSVMAHDVDANASTELWRAKEPCIVSGPGSVWAHSWLALPVRCVPNSGGWDARLNIVRFGQSTGSEYGGVKEPEFVDENIIVYAGASGIQRLDLRSGQAVVLAGNTAEVAVRRPIMLDAELSYIRSDYKDPSLQVHGYQRTLVRESLVIGDRVMFQTEKFVIRDFDLLDSARIVIILEVRR